MSICKQVLIIIVSTREEKILSFASFISITNGKSCSVPHTFYPIRMKQLIRSFSLFALCVRTYFCSCYIVKRQSRKMML